jgi:hypothetical protein
MKRFYFQETDYCSAVMRNGHGKADQQIRPWWNISGWYIFYEALQPLGNPLGTLPGSYSYTYHRQVDAV